MAVSNAKELLAHLGHDIVIVHYAGGANVCIECETCQEVLIEFDEYEEEVKDEPN